MNIVIFFCIIECDFDSKLLFSRLPECSCAAIGYGRREYCNREARSCEHETRARLGAVWESVYSLLAFIFVVIIHIDAVDDDFNTDLHVYIIRFSVIGRV